MKVKPLANRVLIKIEEAETKTASGLFIPQTAQEKTLQGVVVAIGDNKDEIKVKEGDKVMYDKYAGTPLKIDGVDHLIIEMKDVIAIIQ